MNNSVKFRRWFGSRVWAFAIAFTTVVLLEGCGTIQAYEGPKKAATEIATIKTNVGEIALVTVWVGWLDGKELIPAYSTLEVAPGTRLLRVVMKTGRFLARSTSLSLDAQSGHTYRLFGDFRSGKVWIVDEGSGDVVAGEKP